MKRIRDQTYVVVRVEPRVGAKSVVKVAEDLLVGQKRVLSLERVRRRVEEHLHEVGFDHSTPENWNI
jgi:ABC-type microcin C transport system duplicated ATPase subunit YejF